MRTPVLFLTIAAAGGLLGSSLGEDLWDKNPPPVPAPAPDPAPVPDPAATAPAPAPEATAAAPLSFNPSDPSQYRVGQPSQQVAARTLPGIRIWSAKVLSKTHRKQIALFEVERWVARDTWARVSFHVNQKERIGTPKAPKGQLQPIDFTTRWAFLDVTEKKVLIHKTRTEPIWNPNQPGHKIGEKQVPYDEEAVRDVLRLAYLDANGNPAVGKDGKPIEVTVESGAKNPVELPAVAERDILPAAPKPETP